jgi:peptide deformylase
MKHRPFVMWPDKRLATPAEDVGEITPEILAIWDEMILAMDAMPGVGLAAVQLGIMRRLAVVDGSVERGRAVRLANPEIVAASDDTRPHDEGSPNLPGVSAKLRRPAIVTVRYMDENGRDVTREFRDVEATSVQHQIDHLAGRMYFDRLSRMKRDMLIKKARKLAGKS